MARQAGAGALAPRRTRVNKKALNPQKAVRSRRGNPAKLTPSERNSFKNDMRNSRVKYGSRTPKPQRTSTGSSKPRSSSPRPSSSPLSPILGIPGFGGLDQMNRNTSVIKKALDGRRSRRRVSRRPRS